MTVQPVSGFFTSLFNDCKAKIDHINDNNSCNLTELSLLKKEIFSSIETSSTDGKEGGFSKEVLRQCLDFTNTCLDKYTPQQETFLAKTQEVIDSCKRIIKDSVAKINEALAQVINVQELINKDYNGQGEFVIDSVEKINTIEPVPAELLPVLEKLWTNKKGFLKNVATLLTKRPPETVKKDIQITKT
jgi:hypothetical protein